MALTYKSDLRFGYLIILNRDVYYGPSESEPRAGIAYSAEILAPGSVRAAVRSVFNLIIPPEPTQASTVPVPLSTYKAYS